MILLKDILTENSQIKWIIGYIDGYDKVHYKVIKHGDKVDNHNMIWNGPRMKKWRWQSDEPLILNTYGNNFDDDDSDKVWTIIDRYI
jgi:hypothetical protein